MVSPEVKRTHAKSRNGCMSCKKRHLKCDEQRPQCANCSSRDLECRYNNLNARASSPPKYSPAAAFQTTFSVRPRKQSPGSSSPPLNKLDRVAELLLQIKKRRLYEQHGRYYHQHRKINPNAISLSPLAFARTDIRNANLELELMHRWSTRSWMILYVIPECRYSILNYFTRDALAYPFVTKQILAVAALDTAINGGGSNPDPEFYVRTCINLMNESSAENAKELEDMTRDKYWPLVEFHSIHAILLFSLPKRHGGQLAICNGRPNTNIIDRTATLWEISKKSIDLVNLHLDWIMESRSSASVIFERYPFDSTLLDTMPEVNKATEAISHVSRLAHLPPTGDPNLDDQQGRGPYPSVLMSYRLAGGHTRYAFAEDRIKNYPVSICGASFAHGPEFLDGVRSREPVALFTLMFWGVLLHAMSFDPMIWWTQSSGRELVNETSEIIATSSIIHLQDVKDGIAWCRERAALDPILFP